MFNVDYIEASERRDKRFRRNAISRCFLIFLGVPGLAGAGLYVNPSFLSDDASSVADLESIVNGAVQPQGEYQIDLYLNNTFIRSQKIAFVTAKEGGELLPTFNKEELEALGVNMSSLNAGDIPGKDRKPLNNIIADATSDYDTGQQKLMLTIPQKYITRKARDSVAPELWDNGVTALLLNYDASVNKATGGDQSDSYFLNLQSGVNLGAWRLRDYSTLQYSSNNGGDPGASWQHINTYLQRPLPGISAMLTLGENYTHGDLFDAVNLSGVQLASDDNMLPDSQHGFAPTIHGIAKSNAQVTVQQNGYTIYQTTVPPGAFELDDLYPTSDSGDLSVTVKESDGSESHFTVPYSAVPTLQREGHLNYTAAVGRYKPHSSEQNASDLVQSTLFWGGPLGITPYGGIQLSEHYQALAAGLGLNLGVFGGVSMDVTQANSTLADDSRYSGYSSRFLYSRSLESLGTRLQLTGYRYSTQGFYSFEDTTWKRMQGEVSASEDSNEQQWDLNDHKRARFQASLTQPLKDYGSLYVTASQQNYWKSDRKDRSLQWGYSTNWHDINVNLSYSQSHSDNQANDRQISLNISLPLSRWLSPTDSAMSQASQNDSWVSINSSQDSSGHSSQNLSLDGSALEGKLIYGVQQGIDNKKAQSQGASVGYKGSKGEAKAGWSRDSHNQRINMELSGGAIVHSHGVTFSQHLADTNILVAAPGAGGLGVDNAQGISTDSRGYAVIPGASVYHHNRVALRTDKMSDDMDVDDNVADVIPTEGAIVEASFNARKGIRALITLTFRGKPVPFGATVVLENDSRSTLASEDGSVYFAGLPETGTLNASWGQQASQHCKAHFNLHGHTTQSLTELSLSCE